MKLSIPKPTSEIGDQTRNTATRPSKPMFALRLDSRLLQSPFLSSFTISRVTKSLYSDPVAIVAQPNKEAGHTLHEWRGATNVTSRRKVYGRRHVCDQVGIYAPGWPRPILRNSSCARVVGFQKADACR